MYTPFSLHVPPPHIWLSAAVPVIESTLTLSRSLSARNIESSRLFFKFYTVNNHRLETIAISLLPPPNGLSSVSLQSLIL